MTTGKKEILNQLVNAPEKALPHLNLVYTKDSYLTIFRKPEQDKFIYVKGKRPLSDASQIERIEGLVIPPAWKNVRITHLENGHLQAVGRDKRDRKQYRYHNLWSKIRNQTKFFRLADFGKNLPKIREAVEQGLSEKEWTQSKVVSLALKIMDETHIRIGNTQYAKRNNTYGLATLRKKHVVDNKNKLRFEFLGKRGKKHRVTIRNKRLVRLIRQCEEIPGWELFQFFDEAGRKRTIDSKMVNDFLYEVTHQDFTAKDFRTWSGTVAFYEKLKTLREEESGMDPEKMVLQCYDAAAQALGNTRNVCRKYYVHPEIVNQVDGHSAILNGGASQNSTDGLDHLTVSEQEVLEIIEKYQPNLKKL